MDRSRVWILLGRDPNLCNNSCDPQKTIGKLRISILFFALVTVIHSFCISALWDLQMFAHFGARMVNHPRPIGMIEFVTVFFGFEKAMARGASVFPASCSASIGSTWSEHLRSCRWTWIGLICFSWASFFKAKVASTQQAVEVTVDQNRWTKIWFLVILLNEATPRNSQPWCGVGILWYAKHHRVAGKISSKESALKRIMLFRESRNKSCKWRATFRTRKKLL